MNNTPSKIPQFFFHFLGCHHNDNFYFNFFWHKFNNKISSKLAFEFQIKKINHFLKKNHFSYDENLLNNCVCSFFEKFCFHYTLP